MYRYNVGEQFVFCDTIHYKEVHLNVDSSKLFHLDEFNVKEDSYEIVYSQIRSNMYIAGILDLTKTYGNENKKKLYKCEPDDRRIPSFLIPYQIPPQFDKSKCHLYISFQYKHWDEKHPYGIITNNLGNVNELSNTYEYMLYCKSLNQPIQHFTKKSIEQMKKHENVIDEITEHYQLPTKKGHIFTIDSTKSVDYDDAISIENNIVSVYISNVAIVLDYLNLWDSFSKRISTIYLPDKKRSMLPSVLSDCICSLKQKTSRICLVKEFEFCDGIGKCINTYVCKANISRNYGFDDEKILNHKDYENLKKLVGVNTTNDLISKLMILYNEHGAKQLNIHKKGIYKHIPKHYNVPKNVIEHIERFKNNSTKYNDYQEEICDYLQITSPIRRLIDLLNMYLLCKIELNISFQSNAHNFYHQWLNQLDYINITMRYIRKLQSKCKLLSLFESNQNKVFDGYVFDQIKRCDERYHYNIYLPELNIFSSINCNMDLPNHCKYSFKLFMFHDEALLKKKLKLSFA